MSAQRKPALTAEQILVPGERMRPASMDCEMAAWWGYRALSCRAKKDDRGLIDAARHAAHFGLRALADYEN